MNRPKVIVLVAASVDGRISLGPNRTIFDDVFDPRTPEDQSWDHFEKQIYFLHQPQADVLGSNSLVREGAELEDLPTYNGDVTALYEDYLPPEVLERPDHQGWLVVVDGRGRVRSGYKGSADRPGWHMLHLVSHGVSAEYLAFLQTQQIPYLIAGDERVDLTEMLKKLQNRLGINSLVTTAGGKLGGALLRAGLVDEVNILLQPRLIGGFETPSLFDSPDLQAEEMPTSLSLRSAQIQPDGHLWLRYQVEPEMDGT